MARKPKTHKPTAAVAKTHGGVAPVKAVHRINGTILPGTIFTPKSEDQRDELLALEAVVELDATEAKLFAHDAPDPEPEPDPVETDDTDPDEIA